MNPSNLNGHLGIPHHHHHQHHHHPTSHSSTQLQTNSSPLHSLHHTQLHSPHTHSHSNSSNPNLPSHYHLHHPAPPEHLAALRDSIDHHQVQQRTNIEHYKSSANPAFRGYIETTHDALIIFNACHSGLCPTVTRRLHERERRSIDSGAVYVFDEAEAGIKRWTDGRMWSPSRILNNFLVYREIDQKRQPTTTNASTSNINPLNTQVNPNDNTLLDLNGNGNNSLISNNLNLNDHSSASSIATHHPSSAASRPGTPSHPQHSIISQNNQTSPKTEASHSHEVSSLDSKPCIPQENQAQSQSKLRPTCESQSQTVSVRRPMNRERERALVGSLTSTYKFRPDGLVKKTISLAGLHMISYYRMEDVLVGRLRTPKTHDELRRIPIHERFLQQAFFRVPPSWGYSNGSFWVQDEGPEEPSQITSINHPSQFQNGQGTASQSITQNQSMTSNSVQSVRGSHIQHHSNATERLLPSALSRPSSSSSSAGSPSATSPVSSNTFPILTSCNLNAQASASQATVVNLDRGQLPLSRLTSHSTSSSSPTSGPIVGRTSVSASSSTRYEPYPRPTRSPTLPVSSTVTNNTLNDQQSMRSYYTQNSSTGGVNGFVTNPFLSDSHSTSLVAPERCARPDSTAHSNRTLDSTIGQVNYGDSGSYRTNTTTGEPIYAQFTSTQTSNNNSNRSASVPPSPYGLPSINRLRVAGQPGSTSSSNTDARGMGDYQFSASPTQRQASKLSSPNLSHAGSYGAYLSPVPTEFRCQSNLPGRENNQFNSSSQPLTSSNNPSGQTSCVSGNQSPTFLYPSPPTSTSATSFSSNYQFSTNMINQQPQGGKTSRRGSEATQTVNEMDRDNAEFSGGANKLSSSNKISNRVSQRNEDESTACHWSSISSSQPMKTEESGSG